MKKFCITNLASFEDPRLDVFSRLTDNQLRNRLDPARAVMICETPFVVETALKCGQVPYSLLTDTAHILQASEVLVRCGWHHMETEKSCDDEDEDGTRAVRNQPGIPLFVLSSQEMERLTGYTVTRGLLAAMKRPESLPISVVLKDAHAVAVLENLVDVSNVGAVFRNAAALNVDAVLLAPHCADHLTRRSIRVSMGTVFQVPWARVPKELWVDGLLHALHEEGFVATALAFTDKAIPLTDVKHPSSGRHALFFGSEGYGLDRHTIEACDQTAVIPMTHGVDSLNVAASSAVAFWELFAREQV